MQMVVSTHPAFDMGWRGEGWLGLRLAAGRGLAGVRLVRDGTGGGVLCFAVAAFRGAVVVRRAAGFGAEALALRLGMGGGVSSPSSLLLAYGIWNVVRHFGHTTVPF